MPLRRARRAGPVSNGRLDREQRIGLVHPDDCDGLEVPVPAKWQLSALTPNQHVVADGAKPDRQRHLGRGENRSGDLRCLSPTGGALVQRAGLDDTVLLAAAHRADETGWPTPAQHCLKALSLCSIQDGKLGLTEALLKLNLVARHHLNPHKQPRVPVSYHPSMAENSR